MLAGGRLIERYTVAAILPYFALALVLLTAILVTQQAARFAEILGGTGATLGVTATILIGLLPNILLFTLPMSMLVGAITGFSRMGGDSELTALRAAGVGTLRILAPVLLLGAVLSALTLYVAFDVAPRGAQSLRGAALRAALYKLESPVEPRSFYTEMPGKVIYMREGDQTRGQWERVFIHWLDTDGEVRLITSESGRIDVSGEQSELVLSDARVTTLPAGGLTTTEKGAQVSAERSSQLRVRDDRLNTSRSTLLKRLRERELELDEMGWADLSRRMRTEKEATARRNAATTLHKKIALCFAPVVFAIFGTALGGRVRRGGRGLGVLISLAAMIAFYLVSLAGEQLGRAGIVPPLLGAWLGVLVFLAAGGLLLLDRQGFFGLLVLPTWFSKPRLLGGHAAHAAVRARKPRRPLLSGLLNRYIVRSLTWSFMGVLALMAAVFEVFTLFELLRFITLDGAGARLVPAYLLHLLPFIVAALMPLSTLVAVLITYALMARRREAVAWWASGQSVYRLIWPGLIFAALIGGGLWGVQERLMPKANQRQNALRARIKGGIARAETRVGRQWLSTTDSRRLYSYEYDAGAGRLVRPEVYEFDEGGVHLSRVVAGAEGRWAAPDRLELVDCDVLELAGGAGPVRRREPSYEIGAGGGASELFKPALKTPSEMTMAGLSAYLKSLKRRGESTTLRVYAVALERRRADPFAPLAMTLVGAPLAFAFGRRSTLAALCAAVVTGLAFWGTMGGFQQLGLYGLLPPSVAAWSPFVIFSAVGLYYLARSRT